MNSIDLLLFDLIQIAEAPVYTAYRWLGRQLGRDLSMVEFLHLIERLVEEDIVSLWAVDVATHGRTRWAELPYDLGQRYAEVPDLDESFDPFGLSLTLGSAADVASEPEWEVDFDFDELSFVVTTKPDAAPRAQQHLSRLFPDCDFAETERSLAADRVRITGSIAERPPREADERDATH